MVDVLCEHFPLRLLITYESHINSIVKIYRGSCTLICHYLSFPLNTPNVYRPLLIFEVEDTVDTEFGPNNESVSGSVSLTNQYDSLIYRRKICVLSPIYVGFTSRFDVLRFYKGLNSKNTYIK